MSRLRTHDGPCIIIDGEHVVIAPSWEEAEAELRRRQAEARPCVPAYSPWGRAVMG